MFRTTLKQIWNQRRQNGWIFFELLFVGIFLWIVLDPLCVQIANKNINRGYEQDGMYILTMNKYPKTSQKYSEEMNSDSLARLQYLDIIREMRNLPEIESFAVAYGQAYANSGSYNGGEIYSDTTFSNRKGLQFYFFVPVDGGDFLKTYRLKDANTGEIMTIAPDHASRNLIYISENLANMLYGHTDVVGKKCYNYNKSSHEIGGVFKDFKDRDYNQPYPTAFTTAYFCKEIKGNSYMHWSYTFTFRVKDNVNKVAFEKRFENEIKPRLSRGNYYCSGIQRFDITAKNMAERFGELNSTRRNTIFAIFGLLCVFLGMVGTFWVRANARRQEIGVMRSIGASKWRITSQFLTEASILVTVATIISTIIMAHYVYTNDFFAKIQMLSKEMLNPEYWQNNPITHFSVISIIVYLVLLITSLIGTLIPVSRATRELPADALHDE